MILKIRLPCADTFGPAKRHILYLATSSNFAFLFSTIELDAVLERSEGLLFETGVGGGRAEDELRFQVPGGGYVPFGLSADAEEQVVVLQVAA